MKYLLLLCVVLSLAFAACGGSHSTVATNPEVKKEIAKTEVIVKACVTKSRHVKDALSCIAPKGHTKALEKCAINAAAHDALIHKTKLPKDLATCVEENR